MGNGEQYDAWMSAWSAQLVGRFQHGTCHVRIYFC